MSGEGTPARSSIRGPALPKARQWLTWLAHHAEALPGDDGWVRQLRDTLIGLHHGVATAARRLRGNPTWDLQGTMTEDTQPLEDDARRWATQAKALRDRIDLPARFWSLVDVLEGACNQQVRLAREIDRMHRYGELVVDVTLDNAARRLVEAG